MGELRSNHFHGGIDIRTGWASGLPVRAAKSGYVSRVIMAGEGYGNVLFITHPDGYVTLYAHLERLTQPLHDFVKRKQYEEKRFEVDLKIRKDVFLVKQGDTIAISGNTGSSRGPHLHFEIRDTSNMIFNPLSFGFSEIPDTQSPLVDRLAVVPLDINSRVNGKFERKEILVRGAGKEFMAIETPVVSGTVGLELLGRDRLNNGTQKGGIYCIEVYLNDKQVFFHTMHQFPFEKSNHINQLINYRNFRITGEKFQKLYSPDGYFQSAFMPEEQKGKLVIPPGTTGKLDIFLWDVQGNKRTCRLQLKGEERSPFLVKNLPEARKATYDVFDNVLVMKVNGNPDPSSVLYKNAKVYPIEPAYWDESKAVFLHDLRKFMPDSLVVGGAKQSFNFKAQVVPKNGAAISLPGAGVTLPENALFDTLYLEADQDKNGILTLNTSVIPMASPFTVSLPCGDCVGKDSNQMGAYAEAVNGSFSKSLYSECRANNLFFNTKYLGKFKILKDSTPPLIKVGVCNASWARFNIYDNSSGIVKIEATLNGEWVLMVWDKKQHLIYAEPWPHQLPMRGTFRLRVVDKAGNERVFEKRV